MQPFMENALCVWKIYIHSLTVSIFHFDIFLQKVYFSFLCKLEFMYFVINMLTFVRVGEREWKWNMNSTAPPTFYCSISLSAQLPAECNRA